MRAIDPPRRLEGTLSVPGDKSISHRTVMLNSIADGTATIRNFLAGADCLATVGCLRAMGVSMEQGRDLVVEGSGLHGLQEPPDVLNAENSGTTMRLLTGMLAGQDFFSVITGDDSLRQRPMGRIIRPLRLMGAQLAGRHKDSLPPLAITGAHLHGIQYTLPVASAQLKSALLLAGLFAQGPTTVVEPLPTRDHTERILAAMGATVRTDTAALGQTTITLTPPKHLRAVSMRVPGDLSSAAFWLVAAAVHPDARLTLEGVGVNPTRTGVLDILQAMGARLKVENERLEGGEPVANISMESSDLVGTEISGALAARAIDDIPVLAVAATAARGTTVIRDASELRVKESDRIATLAAELARLGASVQEQPDGLIIHGRGQLTGAVCRSHGDHRLAMSLAVAGIIARGQTTIDEDSAVQVSYPGFWKDLDRLAGRTAHAK